MKDLLEENYTMRTIQIWVDDSFMEIEMCQPNGWDEDTFYAAAVDYVLSNISIDVLQESYGDLQRRTYKIYRKLQN